MPQSEQLFDDQYYEVPGLTLPRLLGHTVGTALKVNEYYRICPPEGVTTVFDMNGSNKDALTAESYDGGDIRWEQIKYIHNQPIEGFLRGFPWLNIGGEQVLAVHVFAHYDDINTSSIAVPLVNIEEVYKYPDLFVELEAERHNMAADFMSEGSRKYEVPVLWNNETSEWIKRPAGAYDLLEAIQHLGLLPRQLIGNGCWSRNPSKPCSYRV